MFSVGEFSLLAQVSKRLLRYYDEIELLKPAHIDPTTGYRYYRAEQMAQLNRILVLKELGLSLDQIRRLLTDQISTDEIQGMLLLKKAEIEQQLRAELQRVRKIEARLGAIRDAEVHKPLDVVIKQSPSLRVLSVQTIVESFEAGLALHRQVSSALPARSGYGLCFTICHDEDVVNYDMHLEIGRIVEAGHSTSVTLYGGLQLNRRMLPAVPMMATTIVTGGLESIHAGYGDIAQWVESNEYRLSGSPREMTLQAARTIDGGDLVTEIQVPVEPLYAEKE